MNNWIHSLKGAIISLSFTFCAVVAHSQEAQLTLMSYNIRLDLPSDGENRWDKRKEVLTSQILFLNPDILGIQEGLPHQVDHLAQSLDEYAYTGVGRDDGKHEGEFSAIFYNANKVEYLAGDTFWLSETPSEPSLGWGLPIAEFVPMPIFATERLVERIGFSTPISTTRSQRHDLTAPN
ncbi:endonuclease/exonuclease/phosphatase family protein [Pelagicoccus mobilis]|uniref:Endonuclease/exonuclease/phosphatase domain-containing protein n=1 Tax=Pelagicoccus mobilis TaxID=415221 RepID=A0A934VSB0_9BACT|nr:hypothetical protein [Pelagicoccus mobilis]MBK1878483.1 hypothetical protein [Pelagicoccus mobilis]